MADLPEADELASDPATALSAAGRPIAIENGDTTQRPDTDPQTLAGNGNPKTIGPGNRDTAVGDGRRQNGQDAARPSGARAEPAEQMRAQPGDAVSSRAAEGRVAEAARANASMLSGRQRPDPVAQRVTVVSSQTAPLTPPIPAAGQLMPPGTPASQIVSAIREDGELASRAATAISQAQEISAARPRPVHTLQIQLHPADLGRVTARMSIEGSQLRVELQVETAQARTQLTNDSDAILKALKASGYEIDRVTIQQAPQAANAGPSAGQERSTNGFSAQGGEADEAGAERRRREGSGDGNQQQGGSHESRHSETARGGLYI
jgi:chemotaxis protein MotD